MRPILRTLLAAALTCCCLALPAQAGPIEKLRAFIEQTRSAKASFSQTVTDSGGQVAQKASGTVQFERPGRFRWTYDKPYEQLIVGDGQKLWIYDQDLNQVTERKLDKALDELENDHDFLLEGDVFTADVIHYWIKYKRENEVDAIRIRPHPYEFCMYFDI